MIKDAYKSDPYCQLFKFGKIIFWNISLKKDRRHNQNKAYQSFPSNISENRWKDPKLFPLNWRAAWHCLPDRCIHTQFWVYSFFLFWLDRCWSFFCDIRVSYYPHSFTNKGSTKLFPEFLLEKNIKNIPSILPDTCLFFHYCTTY